MLTKAHDSHESQCRPRTAHESRRVKTGAGGLETCRSRAPQVCFYKPFLILLMNSNYLPTGMPTHAHDRPRKPTAAGGGSRCYTSRAPGMFFFLVFFIILLTLPTVVTSKAHDSPRKPIQAHESQRRPTKTPRQPTQAHDSPWKPTWQNRSRGARDVSVSSSMRWIQNITRITNQTYGVSFSCLFGDFFVHEGTSMTTFLTARVFNVGPRMWVRLSLSLFWRWFLTCQSGFGPTLARHNKVLRWGPLFSHTLHHRRQTMNDKRWAARQRGLRYRCLEPSVCLYVHTQLISWITTMRISKTIWKFYIWKMNKKSWWILMGVRKQAAINSTKLSAIVENCVAVAVNSTQLSTIVDNCCELCCCSH